MTNTNSNSFIEKIHEHANNRYIIQSEQEADKYIVLAHESLLDKNVVRLRRSKADLNSHWRTVLIVVLNDLSEQKIALRWAGEVRRELPDPEASDLYMILSIQEQPSMNDCTRIESREEFCRKFVLRPDESIDDLVSRTFITHLSEEESTEKITDPLTEALRRTENEYSWFDTGIQKHWKKCLLSGETGSDLIEKLYADILLEDQPHD